MFGYKAGRSGGVHVPFICIGWCSSSLLWGLGGTCDGPTCIQLLEARREEYVCVCMYVWGEGKSVHYVLLDQPPMKFTHPSTHTSLPIGTHTPTKPWVPLQGTLVQYLKEHWWGSSNCGVGTWSLNIARWNVSCPLVPVPQSYMYLVASFLNQDFFSPVLTGCEEGGGGWENPACSLSWISFRACQYKYNK